MNSRTTRRLALLLLLALGALLVHGYHPGVEDAEIYSPGIKKDLNPSLYPFGSEFFMSHAHMTLFDETVAASIRITHIPFDYAVFFWHVGCLWVLLAAAWRVGRYCFGSDRAAWGGTILLAALLTIPVAGTALYIMDQYLTTRDLSTAGIMLVIANAVELRWWRAGIWLLATAAIHPLMVVFAGGLVAVLFLQERSPALLERHSQAATYASVLPLLLQPPSVAYRQALDTRSYFFLDRWHWYEQLGIIAPIALLWWIAEFARKRTLPHLERMCKALIVFDLLFFAIAVVLIPRRLANFALLQPLRSLHLVFILMFVLVGGVLAETLLQHHFWRWLLLFAPLSFGMFYAQRQTFPDTAHLELPWRASPNPWVQGFQWIRDSTPRDAVFAANPRLMVLPGEDQHGFRAIAERSILADAVKDSGAVTMFPAMAQDWQEQLQAQAGWTHYTVQDFRRLHQQFGINWLLLDRSNSLWQGTSAQITGLSCPYQNSAVLVCRLL